MGWNSGPRGVLTGLAAVALGLGALYLSAPHVTPWSLRCLDCGSAWGAVQLHIAGVSARIPAWLIAPLAAAFALAPFAANRDLRAAVAAALRAPRARIAAAASAAVLLFTLVPTDQSAETLLGLALGSAGVALVSAGLVSISPRAAAAVATLAGAVTRRVAGMPRRAFLACVSAVFFVACDLGNAFLFGRIPHVVDAMDQLFHAKMFLAGRLTVPPPVPLEAFDLTHMISRGHAWYSQYPPGHTILLALGLWLRAPWVVNALFGSLGVVLLYELGRELYDETTARIAAVLGMLSPFLLLMSSSFMNHTTASFFFLLFGLFFARMARRGGVANAIVAGAALGCEAAIRPMDAVAAALPMAVYALLRLAARTGAARTPPLRAGERRSSWPVLCGIALAAFAVPVAGLLAFDDATNGSPWISGFQALNGVNALPGFGHSGWWGTPHTPALGLIATWQNLASLHQYLFGWPIPSVLLAIAGFTWMKPRLWDRLLAASVISLALAYATYWYHDLTLGPRFMYSATGPVVLLTARSLCALGDRLQSARLAASRRPLISTCVLVLVLCVVYAGTVTAPVLARYYSRDYFDANASAVRAVGARRPHDALVFVPPLLYPSFFPLNDPMLSGDVIYARDRGDEANQEVIAHHPGRQCFKLHALEHYELLPYVTPDVPGDGLYALAPRRGLIIEALTSQMGLFKDCMSRDRKCGDFGPGWKNADYLEVQPHDIGAEVGFAIADSVAEVRKASLVLTRAPDYGTVEIVLNEAKLRDADLYSPAPDTLDLTLPDLHFRPGVNLLFLRVTGKNAASASYGVGIDYLRILRGDP